MSSSRHSRAIPSAVEVAYRGGEIFESRKALLDDWAVYLAKLPAEVIRPRFSDQMEVVG